jgi:hypothetical protein
MRQELQCASAIPSRNRVEKIAYGFTALYAHNRRNGLLVDHGTLTSKGEARELIELDLQLSELGAHGILQ